MKIRLATRDDIPAITDLFLEFYWKFNMNGILEGVSKELLKVDDPKEFSSSVVNSYFDDKEIIYVCEDDNKIIGYICGTIKNHKHYLRPLEANIFDWFTTESVRGKGVGRALYDQFLKDVKAKGCNFLTLEVFWTNKQTIETYERMGFTKEEVVMKKII